MNTLKAQVLFNPKLPQLSKNEEKVLVLLVEAGKLIEPIYLIQENNHFPGANFYPHGIAKKEIQKAAAKNPEILSPYTVVEKQNGKLVAIPYHEKYANLLKPAVEKLLQAAKVLVGAGCRSTQSPLRQSRNRIRYGVRATDRQPPSSRF